ncbi:MAG TPA: DUF3617 family protein [Burkholderiales bacterium]|nr:DUF3617 family protein [Burkholderiales bacterium]
MRKVLAASLFLALAPASPSVMSADISPGLWEILMETRVPADPGFTPPQHKITQCISPQDAKEPGALFSQMGTPGATDCRYSDRNYHEGNTFTFAMKCAGTLAIRSNGKVAFTPETMNGTINAFANVGSQEVETQSKIVARRVGGC